MKIAIIGAGSMGRRHIQIVRDMGLEIVGVCDQREDALATVAAEFGLSPAQLFTRIGSLLATTKPDCAIIATTTPSHYHYTVASAEAGVRYILCEKPMAASLKECDAMIAICKQYGVQLAINHQMRFMKPYQSVKAMLSDESFGGLTSVTIVGGNFGFAMNATHMFEMFRFMTDEPVDKVTAWFSPDIIPNPRGSEFQDRAGSMRVVTASGKRLYIEVGSDQGHGITMIYAGRYGQAIWEQFTGALTVITRQPEHRGQPTTRYGLPADRAQLQFEPANVITSTRLTLESLLSGGNYPTGEDGRNAIATLVAGYVSAENGNIEVKVDTSTLPSDRSFPWA